ncbi:MAG: hypothetical protein R2728_13730 [Chitinophagales bacterium]
MMRHLLKITMVIAISLSFTGCYNAVESALYDGNYENALEAALKKLKNDRKHDEYLAIAEKAYNKVLSEEKYRIERLKSNGDPSDWGQIFDIYRNMEYRQNTAEPYLPLFYNDGTEASFPTFNYIKVIEEARQNAAEYHYQTAQDMLAQPYKEAARDAYYELDKINRYYNNYKDKAQLKYLAKEKGTNHVLLEFKQAYNVVLPPNFLNVLSEYNYERYMDDWSRLYRTWTDTFEYDLAIQVTVEGVEISPEYVKEVHFHEEKTVEDGTQPLVNSEGNYVVDSLGQIIKVPKYKTLYCHVTEWEQNKSARIYSSFEIYDNRYQQKIVNQRLEDNTFFANNYASANGHIEILNRDLRNKLNNRPLPFPNNYDMILKTSNNLKQQIANAIDRYDNLLAGL